MNITRNEQGYNNINIDFNNISFEDYLSLCKLVKAGKFSQEPSNPFLFSGDDITFMLCIASNKDLNLNSTCEKYFEILRKAVLDGTKIIPFTNKFETRVAHKIIWFFQKKLVNASKNGPNIIFNSQDFANFDYDLLKLSNYYKKNSNLQVAKNCHVSLNKQRYLRSRASAHYCDIIDQNADGFCNFKLLAPLPINYELV